MAYYRSYGLPVIVTRGNNVYGPCQYPEKVMPKFINLTLRGRPWYAAPRRNPGERAHLCSSWSALGGSGSRPIRRWHASATRPTARPHPSPPFLRSRAQTDRGSCLHGDGSSRRSFLYVTDVARAFDTLLHKGVPGEVQRAGDRRCQSIHLFVAHSGGHMPFVLLLCRVLAGFPHCCVRLCR